MATLADGNHPTAGTRHIEQQRARRQWQHLRRTVEPILARRHGHGRRRRAKPEQPGQGRAGETSYTHARAAPRQRTPRRCSMLGW